MRHSMISIGVFMVLTVAATGISQVVAHHSASKYDMTRSEVLKGNVVELRWVNPHVTLKGALKSGDAQAVWVIETTSPGNLTRVDEGWQRDTVKPGEAVEVVFHPLRESGRRLGLLRQLTTLYNGRVYAANIRDQQTADLE
jgi:uncharacterized protein DUF6152